MGSTFLPCGALHHVRAGLDIDLVPTIGISPEPQALCCNTIYLKISNIIFILSHYDLHYNVISINIYVISSIIIY